DLVTLTSAFREPPAEELLLAYLASDGVHRLLHDVWNRTCPPWSERRDWLQGALDELIQRRLLERVGPGNVPVIDAHPLVRRGFEPPGANHQEQASVRAGFLRGRPDRRRAETLDEARGIVELFHASCDAGLWAEADSALRALENPKQR